MTAPASTIAGASPCSIRPVEAWVYVWVGPPRGEPLDAEDWRAWLALRGER